MLSRQLSVSILYIVLSSQVKIRQKFTQNAFNYKCFLLPNNDMSMTQCSDELNLYRSNLKSFLPFLCLAFWPDTHLHLPMRVKVTTPDCIESYKIDTQIHLDYSRGLLKMPFDTRKSCQVLLNVDSHLNMATQFCYFQVTDNIYGAVYLYYYINIIS